MLQALIYRQLTQSTSTFLQNAVRCIELTRADEVGQRDMNQNLCKQMGKILTTT